MNRLAAGALLNLNGRERAVGSRAAVVRFHESKQGFPDGHRCLEIFLLHAPGTIVPAATLHAGYFGAGDQFQQFLRLESDVLRFEVARLMVADLTWIFREADV